MLVQSAPSTPPSSDAASCRKAPRGLWLEVLILHGKAYGTLFVSELASVPPGRALVSTHVCAAPSLCHRVRWLKG